MSKIEYPIFLIDIDSLLLTKFLIKNATLIIVTNGIISFKIEGYFKNERYKNLNKFLSLSAKILDNSNIFIKTIKIDTIKKFRTMYLFTKVNK